MINIVTGAINSGKTTKIHNIYNQIGYGDGFINKKIYKSNINMGQRIIRLSTNESEIFSLKEEFIPNKWNEECRYYNYSFSKTGLEFAINIVDDVIRHNIEPIFIDEIGPLEIYNEHGLFNTFMKVIAIRVELFVAIRDTCLEHFLQKFKINEYKIY